MARYAALLRGINVGGNKKVPMAQLKALLEGLGFTEVVTLLQSGNVVFTAPGKKTSLALEKQLEKAIEEEFGFEVGVVVRSHAELAQAIEANPLEGAEEEPSKFLVVFLSDKPDPKKVKAIDPAAYAPDEFKLSGRELYARFPNGMGRSKLAPVLTSQKLGVTATGRNWNTVKKLLELTA